VVAVSKDIAVAAALDLTYRMHDVVKAGISAGALVDVTGDVRVTRLGRPTAGGRECGGGCQHRESGHAISLVVAFLDDEVEPMSPADGGPPERGGNLYLDAHDDPTVVIVAGSAPAARAPVWASQWPTSDSTGGRSGPTSTAPRCRWTAAVDALVDPDGADRHGDYAQWQGHHPRRKRGRHLRVFAAGGAGAETFAGAGSVAISDIESTVEAYLGADRDPAATTAGVPTDVTSWADVKVHATHERATKDISCSVAPRVCRCPDGRRGAGRGRQLFDVTTTAHLVRTRSLRVRRYRCHADSYVYNIAIGIGAAARGRSA